MDREAVSLLVLRAWVEDRSADALRVRISKIENLSEVHGAIEVVTAHTPQQASDIVKEWLEARLER